MVLLSTAYWPNIHYFFYVLNADRIVIEQHEHYQKQSFRNRTSILSANGKLDLVIPVNHKQDKQKISEVEISYKEAWQIRHWRAITSAYKNSPYFEFFEDELKVFYFKEHELLLDYNLLQLRTILKILKIKKEIELTENYEDKLLDYPDLRNIIHPKVNIAEDQKISRFVNRPYYQTFENKFGFTPNLSILDLLFNQGLQTLDYFPKVTLTL